jgi:alpha-galactosidase
MEVRLHQDRLPLPAPSTASAQPERHAGAGLPPRDRKIREIAGERFILGCGHPMGPSIGIMNGSRISPDVAPFWYPHERPREEGRSDLSTVSTFNAIRNTMVRFWMHDSIWLNDPDCMWRETRTRLCAGRGSSLAAVIGLNGRMMLDRNSP